MVFAENIAMAVIPNGSLAIEEVKLVAFMGLSIIIFVNCMGNVTGAKAANLFLFLKLSAVASIAIIGCSLGIMGLQRGRAQSKI